MPIIYIVYKTSGMYEDISQDVVYVGYDESKAFGMTDDDYYHTTTIEAWYDEKLTQRWGATQEGWNKNFDLKDELLKNINQKESELKQLIAELETIK